MLFDPDYDPLTGKKIKKERVRISKKEWEVKKATYGNKCVICGRTEKTVGVLEKAHIRAHSKGGSQVVPMCPTCHKKYDRGLLTERQLKKLGIDKKTYSQLRPKKGVQKKKDSFSIALPKVKTPKIDMPDFFTGSSKKGERGSSKRKKRK